jgi:hypothetical protein
MLENEIKFCEYFSSKILPNRRNVSTDMVRTAGDLIGLRTNTACSSCLHDSAIDLLNLYNRLLPAYEMFKTKQKELSDKRVEMMIKWNQLKDIDPSTVKKPIGSNLKIGKNQDRLWFLNSKGDVEYKTFIDVEDDYVVYEGGIVDINQINRKL